jgi:CRISPR/Cas system-associated exonuclease Cas4 (RecB family)
MIRAVQSASAAARLQVARQFIHQFSPGDEVLLVGASRGAVDDLARGVAMAKGATFGLHRLSFTQLAARLAANQLATQGRAPSSALGHEAVAARAAFEATKDDALEYFAPVAATPHFPKALARTLLELRLAGITSASLGKLTRSGSDLAELLDRVDALMADAGTSDRASLFATAAKGLQSENRWAAIPLLLLDVPFESDAEASFLRALIERAQTAFITVAAGDEQTVARLKGRGISVEPIQSGGTGDLPRLAQYLFSTESPPGRQQTGELVWFSAPGEGRECVEIARRILKEAGNGVRFDEMAILVRSPQQYTGVLEHALDRAKVPVYFDRGLRRPHPAGRAFLAMLSCAVENFSARRFAEYLSLGQVPQIGPGDPSSSDPWVTPGDEGLGVREPDVAPASGPADLGHEPDSRRASEDDRSPLIGGTLRAPWKWEALLVESAVIGGAARWSRRLNGLAAQYQLQLRELEAEEPDSPRIPGIGRELQNLEHLRAFALPLVEFISAWPPQATWSDWIQRLEGFAPRVLKRSEDVLRVLADLRPMGAVGPVPLTEVRDVLADRLRSLEIDPPTHRYGRVFVGSPHQARGRSFRVVFVPGLAERLFPQKLRDDPLLLDELRHQLRAGLVERGDRTQFERLLLHLAAGAAADRLYVSFPRIETSEARARVPSFYALEIVRAVTGRVPDHQTLERMAAQESRASLAWPAPEHAGDAIDDLEYDLSVLRRLMQAGEDMKGRARYMLALNDCLRRSVTERWARAERRWSQFDGLVRVTDGTRAYLQTQRLSARAYSVSALQKYAACPYQFFLSGAYRLAPLEEPEPLQRMDPLTRGSLFHQVQAEFFRALQKEKLTILEEHMDRVLAVLDDTLARIAAEHYELLAPAIDRVWHDEIGAIRTDLRVWVDRVAKDPEWEPWLFEFAFGLPGQPGHDPESLPDPVTIGGRFILRGSVDLVEKKPGTRILRVTDHKTSKNRSQKNSIIGGGAQLQPVIYSLAVEEAKGFSVERARFSYCTTAGGFTEHSIPINERTRRMGIEVLEIIDRAVDMGMLPPAPNERACQWCDFLPVCGPEQERRANKKPKKEIADLIELRARP